MEEAEREILEKALELFNRFGLKPVTMDDIARELSVSKKTIYKYFQNKESLIRRVIMGVFNEISQKLLALFEEENNAIDQLFEVDRRVCLSIEKHNPSLQFQLERYYPEVYCELEEKRKNLIYKLVGTNLRLGKTQGLYRPELDEELMPLLYYSRTKLFTEQGEEIFSTCPMPNAMHHILIYHLRGMATEQGLQYLTEKEQYAQA